MKKLLLLLLLLVASSGLHAQTQPTPVADSMYRVVKTDGSVLVGKLLQSDAREILFRTQDGREIYIPQHVIKRMEPLHGERPNISGEYVGEDRFATRYFITTNGLPIKRGEHYVQWNLFGPDFHFALRDDLSVGLMTTWLGTPLIGSIKKSWKLNEVSQFAVGGLFGTGSWIMPDWGGALPFGTISFGDRQKNIAFSGGYGAIWADGTRQGRTLLSVAGMVKLSPQLSLVFDSFIMPAGPDRTITYTFDAYIFDPVTNTGYYEPRIGTYVQKQQAFSLLIPGVRWHQSEGRAIQFGFSGVIADGESFPIPMVVWYRSLK
ncbi:MAG: hypothetical protein Q8J69_01110 [Sphingobacteriaceae bacterium]|nr:hypothetical protein [Sphingobacteriaceae bacterium]